MDELYKPTARVDHLVVQQVRDETLVYDMAAHRAYCLNSTAALVWQECTGSASVAEIAGKVSTERSAPDLVVLALDQLAEFGLLNNSPRPHPRRGRDSRRKAIKSLALTALLTIPVISTIATPRNNQGVGSVCVCVSSAQCLVTPGCGNS